MQVSDFILRYPARAITGRDAMCRVRIFATGKNVTALLTDLGDMSTGMSVTNSVEHILKTLVERGHVDKDARFIEHYEDGGQRGGPTFDVVTLVGTSPQWRSIDLAEAVSMLGCTEDALSEPTAKDERLVREIEMTRNHIDPFIDHRYPEDPALISRRDDIRRGMVSREAFTELIHRGASERELQDLIKSDLSLIAEVYAQPEEEYIAFSEFPVADGFVDFALFSGRSRMDVTLIEVKGADFPAVTRGSYQNFSAKFNEAAQQITARLGYIARENAVFREFVHRVRDDVESGRPRYNSFVGPDGPLEVDPRKDIIVRYVLIAGRTTHDVDESKQRHNYELSFIMRIKLETWDSWANKLRRS